MQPAPASVMLAQVEDAEIDEMWSFVQSKKQQRWLWHAIAHRSGKVLAYVLAPHEDAALRQLKELLAPFSVGHPYREFGKYLSVNYIYTSLPVVADLFRVDFTNRA